MNKKLYNKLFFLICILLFLFPLIVHAQELLPEGVLYNLRTSSFPVIQVSMDVKDTEGKFITGLQAEDVTILEDDQEIAVSKITSYDPALEFVVGINPNFSFAISDAQSRSRLDKIKDALTDWSGDLSQTSNHAYSLVTPDGPISFHVKDLDSWLTGLEIWQPPMRTMTPTLDILAQSIDLASTSLLEPGSRRAVLFITPVADADEVTTLETLTEKASQLDVHVFVWVVAPPDAGPTSGMIALEKLADQTGGYAFLYSGSEILPGAIETLAPLQVSYRLTFNSGLRTSGTHTLAVQVKTDAEPIILPPLSFNLDVEPPNPILVTPPNQILRQYPSTGNFDPENLHPNSQQIEMVIEFPDGHPRPLMSTSLLVDGEVVVTNISEPYNLFEWDLTPYSSESRPELQVNVVDSLGLEKTSIAIPISISVEKEPSFLEIFYLQYKQWIIMSVGVLAGLLLIWRLVRLSKILKSKKKERIRATGPLPLKDDYKSSLGKQKEIPANLEPILERVSAAEQQRIPLSAKEIRIGRDPSQVNFVLDDPSVGAYHAILRRDGETFLVMDMESASGTWVNYEQLSGEPRRLDHGDIIHFGGLAYRFVLTHPPDQQEPRIVKLNPET